MGFDMDALLSHSDTMLRPDVGLVLPFVAASTHNWALLLLSVALQPFKWQSGCGCFVKLCQRKKRSVRVAGLVCAMLAGLHWWGGADEATLLLVAGAAGVALSYESADTKVLKTVFMAAGMVWGMRVGGAVCAALALAYAWATGWRLRGRRSVDVLAGNRLWLVTRDARLAKRVNNFGEWHLEYEVGGKVVLVGDGRLVGEGAELKTGLKKSGFVRNEGNLRALKRCVEEGKVVVKGGDVAIVA